MLLYFALVLFGCALQRFPEAACNQAMDHSEGSPSCEAASSSTHAPCMEVVPYNPVSILPVFEERQREFHFAGRKWVVAQQWSELGVAAVVWEAALVLCQYLEAEFPAAVHGKRVVELGAGTGLAGMVALALGATEVLLTDKLIQPAEDNLKLNAANFVNLSGLISAEVLTWGDSVDNLNPPFDVLLAADVIYLEETFPSLMKTLHELSSHETVVLFCCKLRYNRVQSFLSILTDSGNFTFEVAWTVKQATVYRIRKRLKLS